MLGKKRTTPNFDGMPTLSAVTILLALADSFVFR